MKNETSTHSFATEKLAWFHPGLTRHVAESILLQNGQDGAYLLRPSSNPGELALSVRCKDSVKHITVSYDGSEYHFGMGIFPTMADFIQHFENQPMIAGETGVLTQLRYPYPRDVEEPGLYETVRIHAEVGIHSSPERRKIFSVGSKEGYLTKRGAFIKSWKTRWFVLVKNELKYYKSKGEKDPIKTLDLNDCYGCIKDRSQGKENCFSLNFGKRIYYMFATTDEEAHEWLRLLQWKLDNIKYDKL